MTRTIITHFIYLPHRIIVFLRIHLLDVGRTLCWNALAFMPVYRRHIFHDPLPSAAHYLLQPRCTFQLLAVI
jgi:hypothetical protein